ncbi:unnamed protein product, partial [marine sediment metagenome]
KSIRYALSKDNVTITFMARPPDKEKIFSKLEK